MKTQRKLASILMAEDDADYYRLMEDAIKEADMESTLSWVEDGELCMDYLLRRGKYSTLEDTPLPDLILLDLNMPKKNGYETLREIKNHPVLKRIPVVIMTISSAPEDVILCYTLGANSFITKPLAFSHLVETIKAVGRYWFETVALPPAGPA